MKRFSLLLVVFSITFSAFSQVATRNYTKPWGLGINIVANDFPLANYIRTKSLREAINNKQLFNSQNITPGFGISYIKGFTEHIDINATLSAAFSDVDGYGDYVPKNPFLAELATTANIKLLSDKYFFTPFATAGIGATMYGQKFGAFLPVGAGLQFRLADDVFVHVNSQYRLKVTDNSPYHFWHALGFYKTFGKAKDATPAVTLPVVTDRDGDGVLDADDACPDVAGLASLAGCPDRDGDGISNDQDKCPDVAGIARYEGCPIPDSDGDGINDEEDKCPTQRGVAKYNGCPVPDTDGDGVNDELDKCIDRPGPASNQGCPEIAKEVIEKVQFAAKNVYFATASFKLLPKSFKSLNEVAKIMKDDSSLMLDIDGHTDSQGKDEYNQTLSENRAASVKEYLVKQGVDESRLKSTGYGETKPVADNNTAAGRAKNRRTEMTVRNY